MKRSTHPKEQVKTLAKCAWAIRTVIRQVQTGHRLMAYNSLGQIIEALDDVRDALTLTDA